MRFHKDILKNGLRVVSVPMPDNPSVTVLVMVETGSEYETREINGLSHFLEHMVFKGTTRRPKAIDISRELDSIGSSYNAFTSQEYTGYYAKADKKHFDMILDIVSDMFVDPLLPEQEIEKEKGVIVEEIRMYNDLPQRKVWDAYAELLYGDEPAGWNVLGTEELVRSFTREKLVSYRHEGYVSEATTVIVAGDIGETRDVLDKVEKAFAKVVVGKKKEKQATREHQTEPQIKAVNKETDQTHLVIGFRGVDLFDERKTALSVLGTVLGGGMSSRLFAKMRDDLGICYYVNASNNVYIDHGDFSIAAGLDNRRVEEGIKGILEECRRLKEEMVPEDELKKAKDYMSGGLMLGLETSDSRADFFGFQEVSKRKIEMPEEIIARIQAVTAEELRKMAREIFVNEKMNLSIIGRFKDGKEIQPYFRI